MADLRIGFAGLGAMGLPMARNLLTGGFSLTALRHRDPQAPAALADAGATIVDAPADLARSGEAIILMLPSSTEVEEVVMGPDGLEGALRPGQVLVDMGTSDPVSTRALAVRLAGRGVEVIDAPVTGGVKGASDGTLVIMAGGSPAAFERVRPALDVLGSTVVYVGDVGTGHELKLINNLIALSTAALVAEALRLADRAGLPQPAVLEVLEQGSARSAVLQGMVARLRSGRFEPGFKVVLARKDLVLAERLSEAAGVSLPIGTEARRVYDEACERGLGARDTAALATLDAPPA